MTPWANLTPMQHHYKLTDPSMVKVSKHYLAWVRQVRAALDSGVTVQTSWDVMHRDPESFRAELWRAIDRRINLRAGPSPRWRKWSSDYHYAALRDSRRIQDRVLRRVRVYQFETVEARRRFGHLLSSQND